MADHLPEILQNWHWRESRTMRHLEHGRRPLCLSMRIGGTRDRDENEQVARLIAAAPDLLAELRRLEWSLEREQGLFQCPVCRGYHPDEASATRTGHYPDCSLVAAISKATGAPTPEES